jgi:hypothetical protein
MTHSPSSDLATQKPMIVLMGEFSAGKSTLANLLLGQDSSPVQVTATQLPPVCYRLGTPDAQRIARDGTREPLPWDDWTSAQPDQTDRISISLEADFLHACDLVDMPGTSDPNMRSDVWSHFLDQADLVIWCTPANQAWRQSEAALWEQVPQHLWARSLLLVTRMDKMRTERDKARVLARVRAEAGSMFRDVLPISLVASIAGRDDDDVLENTGAATMVRFLCTALEDGETLAPPRDVVRTPGTAALSAAQTAASVVRPPAPPDTPVSKSSVPEAAVQPGRIVPRRITRTKAASSRERPEARSI